MDNKVGDNIPTPDAFTALLAEDVGRLTAGELHATATARQAIIGGQTRRRGGMRPRIAEATKMPSSVDFACGNQRLEPAVLCRLTIPKKLFHITKRK